jgi:hypothetical protein
MSKRELVSDDLLFEPRTKRNDCAGYDAARLGLQLAMPEEIPGDNSVIALKRSQCDNVRNIHG